MSDQNFTQVCVWPGTIVGQENIDEFEKFFNEKLGARVKYIEEVKTFPDVDKSGNMIEGTGGRIDALFYIHREDIPKFAVPRLGLGISWLEDAVANWGNIYPERVLNLRTW